MKKFLLPVCIGAIVMFSACAGEAPETGATIAEPSALSTSPTNTLGGDSTSNTIGTSTTTGTPATATTQPTTTTPVNSGATSKGSVALNPAHGQPNHRCDIEVGAPLNSPAPAAQTITPANKVPTPASSGTVKLNPAHGQPGHDCAVPVGQPLKS